MGYEFTDEDAIKANWWKKDKVGDSIQGTLIRKHEQMNQLSGRNQWIYELRTEDKEFWNVGGTGGIDAQMRNVKIGQIVEFRFIEERPSKKAGMNAAKIVQVFSNKDAVDQEWLESEEAESYKNEDSSEDESEEAEEKETPIDEAIESGFGNDKEAKINALAKTKLGVIDEAKVKEVVMEKTGLAWIDSNLDAIIEKLEAM